MALSQVLSQTPVSPIIPFVLSHLMLHVLCTKLTEFLAHIRKIFLSPPLFPVFVPNESTKEETNNSAITKGTEWAECGDEGSMLSDSLALN